MLKRKQKQKKGRYEYYKNFLQAIKEHEKQWQRGLHSINKL